MRVEQLQWKEQGGWSAPDGLVDASDAQLVLLFGDTRPLGDAEVMRPIRDRFPHAKLVGCSTSGEICGTSVSDDTIVATALAFEHTRVATACRALNGAQNSSSVGEALATELLGDGLVHVFVLSEGLHVNGSDLVDGLRRRLPGGVAVTGGLAGDGARFGRTVVYFDDELRDEACVVVGFYGDRLRVGYGSMGGWDPFGPERIISRSAGNVLYELDGSSALELYRRYLGPHASSLPASGLLFPLSLRGETGDQRVVRTILGIDEEAGSLIFAGDVPQGGYARLMKANVDRLIDGAHGAASECYQTLGTESPDVALLISCVGRKLVLKQRTEEEVESVRAVLGANTVLAGFYSYGEIAPFMASTRCELHNQTMTITTLSER